MATTGGFKREQRNVALAMAGALVVSAGVLALVAITGRAGATAFVARMQFALRAEAFVLIWLVAAIANVARLRFFSEDDIAGSSAGPQTPKVRIARSILQNTFEQVGLAIATHLIAVAVFAWSNALLPALIVLFAIGRLLFWAGYENGAASRAFGFALTFYPSVLVLFAAATAVLFA